MAMGMFPIGWIPEKAFTFEQNKKYLAYSLHNIESPSQELQKVKFQKTVQSINNNFRKN